MASSTQDTRRDGSTPAGRDPADELRRKSLLMASAPLLQTMIDAMPGIVMILNDKRQVVAANRPLLETLQTTLADLLGRRFGEVLACSFWREGPDGCGTSRHCENCGAVQVIRECQAAQGQTVGECDLRVDRPIKGASLELRVKATATRLEGEEIIVCALEDVGSRKRLAELTRLFFHDVLNTICGIQGHLGLLANRLAPGEDRDSVRQLRWLADQLVDEIQSHRDLTLAETGDLEVEPQAVRTAAVVNDLSRLYSAHTVGAGRMIQTHDVWDGMIVTDLRLLGRVLGNMLQNALEATDPGGTVSIRCVPGEDWVEFAVHNAAVIAEPHVRKIFRQSFSTKARTGRGIGMRSIKLLGEHYLRGAVGFSSDAVQGTTFTLRIPKVLQPSLDIPAGEESSVLSERRRMAGISERGGW